MEDDNKTIESVHINGEEEEEDNMENDDVKTTQKSEKYRPQTGDGASPGKIFIGGLARETTSTQFLKHFGKYGEITDSVIMKDRMTGAPRGFGFVTYADASVVDRVMEDTHIINGKQVEIKRTIPRGAGGSKDFKTKKIFVGGIPTAVTEDEIKDFFSNYGEVKEHQLMKDHSTGRSRGFGFVTFEMERAVDDLLSNGNHIEFAGVQVEIKKAEPKKPNPPPPAPSKRRGNPKASFGGGYGDAYGGYGGPGGGMGAGSYRSGGAYGARGGGEYGGYGGSDYGGYGGGGYGGGYRGEPASLGYSGRYSGGYGRGYDMGGGGGGGGGGYGGLGESYGGYGGGAGGAGAGGGYGGGGYGGGYDAGYGGGSYGGGGGAGEGSYYGSRSGYAGDGGRGGYAGDGGRGGYAGDGGRGGYAGDGGRGRYHPYGR